MIDRKTLGLACCLGLMGSMNAGCLKQASGPVDRPSPSHGSSDRPTAQTHLKQAEDYLKRNLPDSALGSYVLALEENPRLVEAHLGMGDIYRTRNDWDKAKAAYQRASDIEPDRAETIQGLAQCELAQGQWDSATRRFLLALAKQPGLWQANRELSTIYLKQGRHDQAMPYVQKAASAKPDDPIVRSNLAAGHLALGQYAQAEKAYRQALLLSPDTPALKLGLAQSLIQLRRFDDAQTILRPLAETWPTARVHERLGLCQAALGQHAAAIFAYRSALKIEPNDRLSLNGLGNSLWQLYLAEGRRDDQFRQQAIEALKRSLVLDPQQPDISQKLMAAQTSP